MRADKPLPPAIVAGKITPAYRIVCPGCAAELRDLGETSLESAQALRAKLWAKFAGLWRCKPCDHAFRFPPAA